MEWRPADGGTEGYKQKFSEALLEYLATTDGDRIESPAED